MNADATSADRRFMRRALDLAERGWGRVHPNPLVGAVVVRDGRIVGEGWHAEYGGAHAEVAALDAAAGAAEGAVLYVTLEPCAHHGKTPPCTDAILKSGIARVVYAADDPTRAAGGGAERLRSVGLEVVGGVERDAAKRQNVAFFHAHQVGDAYVALKHGLSLDGRVAEAPGLRTTVTGTATAGEVHRLRAGFDAIMVGSRTAAIDDPLLTVRGRIQPRVPPIRVVVDTRARLSAESSLVRSLRERGAPPVWLLCGAGAPADRRSALERAGVRTLSVPETAAGIDLAAALDRVRDEGVRSVFCEGGGRLGGELVRIDRVERLYLFYAPRLFGSGGVPAFAAELPAAGRRWCLTDVGRFDDDIMMILDRRRGASGPGTADATSHGP